MPKPAMVFFRIFNKLKPCLVSAALLVGCHGSSSGSTNDDDNGDTCVGVTCGDHATCEQGACVCDEHFVGDGVAGCTPELPCDSDSCNGHGNCTDADGLATCRCHTGWDSDDCSTCATGYTGTNCDTCDMGYVKSSGACVDDPCDPDPCGDHGSCSGVDAVTYICQCDANFAGPNCSQCAAGFEGDACSDEIDECDANPCQNGGVCADLIADFDCDCGSGWVGKTCEVVAGSWPLTDTGQLACYDELTEVECFGVDTLVGQDGHYIGANPRYQDNGDGTITDLNTSLVWQRDAAGNTPYSTIETLRQSVSLPCASEWRLPTIKELYSLIDFSGTDPGDIDFGNPFPGGGYPGGPNPGGDDPSGSDSSRASWKPFLNAVFSFEYGSNGQSDIDSQYPSTNSVLSGVLGGQDGVFGLNFANGRIEGYPKAVGSSDQNFTVMFVCGPQGYGVNDFEDQGDGTVLDHTTDLTWMQVDSGDAALAAVVSGYTHSDGSLNWPEAIDFCEALSYAGYDDWRLPDAHELQSIVEYSRTPDLTRSPAIDPVFASTAIVNEAGQEDWPFMWTSTTHAAANGVADSAVYIAFGRAMGYFDRTWMDVHGPGAQRSDPKTGDPSAYPTGRGTQGDAVRIYNYVRCVRGGNSFLDTGDCDGQDADSDGVCDWRDACPGADDSVDSDGDKTPDACDTCPGTAPIEGVDNDGDGICNEVDNCPDDANPDQQDVCGASGGTCTTAGQDCSSWSTCRSTSGLGCQCQQMTLDTSMLMCVPSCNTDADCPSGGPGGGTFICASEGYCVFG